MTSPSTTALVVSTGAALLGLALTLYCLVGSSRAVRRQAPGSAFGWMVVAGSGYLLLSLAAAVVAPTDDALRAAGLQAGALLLAGALGGSALHGPSQTRPSGSAFGAIALFTAWLSLLGLPPTVGFHARVMVCKGLLDAGWHAFLALALALGVAALVPALGALSLGSPGPVRGTRAALALVLLLAVLVAGLWPGPAVEATDHVLAALGGA